MKKLKIDKERGGNKERGGGGKGAERNKTTKKERVERQFPNIRRPHKINNQDESRRIWIHFRTISFCQYCCSLSVP